MPSSFLNRNTEYMLLDNIKQWSHSSLIGDDSAVLPGGLLASVDTLVEDVHFSLATTNFTQLGWKSLAVNISDIAAMAGRPRHALISLTIPEYVLRRNLESFYEGLTECARAYKVKVAGGDVTKGKSFSVSITILGEVHENGVLKRNGAKPGDLIIVTGDFGASRAGLYCLQNHLESAYCIEKHLVPEPRLCQSWALNRARENNSGAMMDASDGLADAVIQLASKSDVSLILESEKVPVRNETIEVARQAVADPIDWALYGGEDYELVACVSSETWKNLEAKPDFNPFTVIGRVQSGSDTLIENKDGSLDCLDPEKLFQHF